MIDNVAGSTITKHYMLYITSCLYRVFGGWHD